MSLQGGPKEGKLAEKSDATARLHAYVSGRVQGVGFRFFVLDAAQELGLTGWVRNLNDGRVEVLAEGPRPDLERLLRLLHQGPPASWVTGIDATWEPATAEFPDFRAVRTF